MWELGIELWCMIFCRLEDLRDLSLAFGVSFLPGGHRLGRLRTSSKNMFGAAWMGHMHIWITYVTCVGLVTNN